MTLPDDDDNDYSVLASWSFLPWSGDPLDLGLHSSIFSTLYI